MEPLSSPPRNNVGVYQDNVRPAHTPAPAFSLLDGLANAAEELTFQFSEVVEERQHTLEERFPVGHAAHEEQIVPVRQIQAVMRLLAGREGFDRLRSQARLFAQAFREGRPDAMAMLNAPGFFEARERYTLLRLASDVLAGSGAADASVQLEQDASALAAGHGEQLGGLFGAAAALRPAREGGGILPDIDERYYTLLATKPTVRSVLDAVAAAGGGADAAPALSTLQKDWAGNLGSLEQVGTFIAISRLMGAARTMVEHGRELVGYPGAIGARPGGDGALAFQHARAMIDIANSSIPAGLLDKLAAAVLGQTAAARRIRLFAYLHRRARGWPDQIWATPEARVQVLQQLVRKQRV